MLAWTRPNKCWPLFLSTSVLELVACETLIRDKFGFPAHLVEDLSLKSCVMQISVKFSYFIRKILNRDRKLKNIPNIIGRHGGLDKIEQKESCSGLKTVQLISLNLTLRMHL